MVMDATCVLLLSNWRNGMIPLTFLVKPSDIAVSFMKTMLVLFINSSREVIC